MSLNVLSAENIRALLNPILDSIIKKHIHHRLSDNFLILTPDTISAKDFSQLLLQDTRLGGVLTGESVLSVSQWISRLCQKIEPQHQLAPSWVLKALLKPLAKKAIQNLKITHKYQDIAADSLNELITSF